ncbi:DNA-3-methyladenine glycosylase 2 family protein [Saccharomonospora xinjiangensis]|uniref:DNA-3-methyladenine glycosylase family protein n=1 Tax=Saccharomonospora xinjiangensis TaxID=75294 RepID=UPI0010C2BF3C|nr:DNA-3-methyladenine glycosylase 2 family protein [Saccharomonospora xinjiangensis]QBQ61506.1 DNA-3-methyladenine glycosylase [Saccharomonospora xinjiangensis]
MTALAERGLVAVEVEVRGDVDVAEYAAHLARTPQRCGITGITGITGIDNITDADGSARDTDGGAASSVALAFPVERSWSYAAALVSQSAPGVVRIEAAAVAEDVHATVAQACRILSFDVDGTGFPSVLACDPVLARRVRAGPGLRPVLFGSAYEAACWAVVCHRLRVSQADALVRRIAERRGRRLRIGGREVVCFPAPGDLGDLDSSYRLSAVKRKRLAAVAEAAVEGVLDSARLRRLPIGTALEEVRRLPGIGPFSAELVVGRGAGHPDLFPRAESHLTTALRRHYDTDEPGLAAVADLWRPYRGWGAFFFREVTIDEQ